MLKGKGPGPSTNYDRPKTSIKEIKLSQLRKNIKRLSLNIPRKNLER